MLTISRGEVRSDVIQEFTASERFIKLPIQRYLELLGVDPIAPQIALINAINNPKYRFVVACLARRTGKTYIANIIAQLVSLVPNSNVLLVSPNYNLSTISWELQRSLIQKFDLEVAKNNQKDRVITLENGSSIRMGSISQVDSLVGRSYDLILFDEAALSENGEDGFNIQLRPTLDKIGSKAIFISTPRGLHNYFKKFYDRGFSDEYPQWCSIHSDWRENPRAQEADIQEAKNTMTSAEFRQEYFADFTVYQGKIWEFDTETCRKDLSELPYWQMDVIMGVDIGFRDPTAACVIAYDYDTQMFYVIDEYYSSEKTTSKHAAAIKQLEDKYNVSAIFVDSAAAQTRYDWAQDHEIATIGAKKSVLDGIAAVGRVVDNNKLIVGENCTKTLEALDQYQWKDTEGLEKEKPVHNDASHMADALRYAIYSYTT
jgi:phage terminase large subunit